MGRVYIYSMTAESRCDRTKIFRIVESCLRGVSVVQACRLEVACVRGQELIDADGDWGGRGVPREQRLRF